MAANLSAHDLNALGAAVAASLKDAILNELKTDIRSLIQAETKHLHDEIVSLKTENQGLKNAMIDCKLEIDELEQYGRRMCLNISNVPGDTGDNTENLEKKVLSYTEKLNLGITANDIDRCHRLGKRLGESNRKTVIKFTNSSARYKLYGARKKIGDGIFVQENLTRFREKLAYEARQLVRSDKLDKTWVAGCNIYAQLPHTVKSIHIKDLATIELIREGKPLPSAS